MKKRNLGVILGALVVIAVISGAVTSFMLFHQEKNNKELLEEKMTDEGVTEEKEKTIMGMEEILDGVDEIYLESYLGSNHIIEIDDTNLESIIGQLKSLDLKLLMKSEEVMEDIEEYNRCLYAIHIKDKNMKIKVNEKYVIIEDVQGGTQFFEGDLDQLKKLNEALKSIYMGQYDSSELFTKVKMVYIEAKDEEKQWILNEEGVEKFLQVIKLMAPVDGKELVGTPNSYPDYRITIETEDKNYTIHIIDEQFLTLDTSDSFVYYEYDSQLWDYLHEKYGVTFRDDTNDFKNLLRSSKIIVDDMENQFDFEDDTYYNVEVPRWIIKANLKEVKEIPNNESLKYSMQFIVDEETVEVKIYENHIIFKGKKYYSEKISDIIKGALSV
ncbi:hypothetical protein [Crassaminicella profunda]|uniref:hypothetical protein n=1 Tax=Crassaminicella profunda TaxID=1286698 RepID=UPI001CA67F07|nr:hypothetical protein [Crassaminicella profunda]QZY54747.1 hypothetical protein K7H06_17190 [Crassaminicella profunda]